MSLAEKALVDIAGQLGYSLVPTADLQAVVEEWDELLHRRVSTAVSVEDILVKQGQRTVRALRAALGPVPDGWHVAQKIDGARMIERDHAAEGPRRTVDTGCDRCGDPVYCASCERDSAEAER